MGKTGMRLSVIGIGGWLTYGMNTEENIAHLCLKEAVDQGINFIDVADVYAKGESERVVGDFLSQGDYEREHFVISSKVFGQMSDEPNDRGLSRKHITESITKTLARLKTDYLDIYFCHRFDYHTPLEETVRAMNALIDEGLINYWGVSTWFPYQIERAHGIARELGMVGPMVEQPRYNLLDRWIEIELRETIDHWGMGVVPWSPLAQGILTGKYNDGIPEGSRHATYMELADREFHDDIFAKLRQVDAIAKEQEITLTQLSLAWMLSRDWITSPIIGASKPEQVTENADAGDINLDAETVRRIEEIMDNEPLYHPIYNRNNYREFRNGEI
jgi:voltage-dependent potassium channel beta subunit